MISPGLPAVVGMLKLGAMEALLTVIRSLRSGASEPPASWTTCASEACSWGRGSSSIRVGVSSIKTGGALSANPLSKKGTGTIPSKTT